MGAACAQCGTAPRAGARFCDACGAPITPVFHHPEFKQVTVLFADVVRSMDLAAALGTERLREVMSELFRRSRCVVQHFGGSVDFTGDGIMATFGAPIALEDHAVRACLAALDLQTEATALAAELHGRDGVRLKLRVGLNSGQVITGDIGTGPGNYTVIGAHVGMAQRMEAAAPPGGVLLSGSTAHLVEGIVELGAPEQLRVKNSAVPVPARRLLSAGSSVAAGVRSQSTLVGREAEVRALSRHLDAALAGAGTVVGVVGAPGIGKSRLVAEVLRRGAARGVGVVSTVCESHAHDVPFHAAARLFRSLTGVENLQGHAARDHVRRQLPAADPADLVLLDDLLGIAEPGIDVPVIDPDARRRRVSALLTCASAARSAPDVYVVEDAHWMDEASESTIADFLSALTESMVLITYRPEYHGKLVQITSLDAITLGPLDDSQASVLIGELVGTDPSVRSLAAEIAEHAAGNPFFAEEIVRDLAERGVLQGNPGSFVAGADATVTGVPPTLQATIAARIDRLGDAPKDALNAAAVIGTRFSGDLLAGLVERLCVEELLEADMIEKLDCDGGVEYGFRHPLIRTVAYESQLRSERVRLHRQLAATIERDGPGTPDANAALIATHHEGAGDLAAAFGWQMRAGNRLALRDIDAARTSWRRAARLAGQLPVDTPDRLPMLIDVGTALCGTAWRIGLAEAEQNFDELRRLCAEHGDRRSLAIGMSGYMMALTMHNHPRVASELASELRRLLESIGDDALAVAASFGILAAKWETGEVRDVLAVAQRVIDHDTETAEGMKFVSSPRALAMALRGVAGMSLGLPGWKDDLDRAIATARELDPLMYVVTNLHKYAQIGLGALQSGPDALRDTASALAVAERSGDDFTVVHAHLARGIVLVARDGAERDAGYEHLRRAREAALLGCGNSSIVLIADIHLAHQRYALGEVDGAVALASATVDELFALGSVVWRGPATSVLIEALLGRGAPGDLEAARAGIARLDGDPVDSGFVLHEVTLRRLRALLARAEGDQDGYRRWTAGYLALARACDFDGHIAVASAMV
ncbi:AAA family ATPase [Mycolicibacterium fluoranthenivorans]|uniref:AAA family ATPase n=1 Tax=Mycolicibacterium fluoranthenivorans TaxID=258505 RepID=A0A7G8PM39_9MYCO|nr:adenylate/guanylate cyclase domain-containing protein [Mycolicibacterium fluoranthenivorans]QNJ95405.1 AAA family ATPase [Mycolicibacterium fluoranthenivorans]